MATALVHGNAKTDADDDVRSRRAPAQPAGVRLRPGDDGPRRRPGVRRRARRPHRPQLRLPGGQGHAQGRRRGRAGQAGAAAGDRPRRRRRRRRPYGVPVTAKFRIGLHDGLLTHLRAGAICADEGVVAIAVHARTVEQHYAGDARWDAIGELKAHVTSIPVLGNGDIWEAADAVRDDARARGATASSSGAAASAGRGCSATCSTCSPAARRRPPRPLGVAAAVMVDHARGARRPPRRRASAGDADVPQARLVVPHRLPGRQRVRRRRFAQVSTLAELDDLVAALDPALDRRRRAASGSAAATPTARSRSPCPDGFLDDLDALEHDLAVPDDDDVMALSGG